MIRVVVVVICQTDPPSACSKTSCECDSHFFCSRGSGCGARTCCAAVARELVARLWRELTNGQPNPPGRDACCAAVARELGARLWRQQVVIAICFLWFFKCFLCVWLVCSIVLTTCSIRWPMLVYCCSNCLFKCCQSFSIVWLSCSISFHCSFFSNLFDAFDKLFSKLVDLFLTFLSVWQTCSSLV